MMLPVIFFNFLFFNLHLKEILFSKFIFFFIQIYDLKNEYENKFKTIIFSKIIHI